MINIERARMQQKHDVAENWNNIDNFVPKSGEIIVYDRDENTKNQSIKIGDGETAISELGLITGEVYAQKKQPKNASEGAIWISPENNSPSQLPEENETIVTNSNWLSNYSEQEGFIKNRPFWYKQDNYSIPWNDNAQQFSLLKLAAYYVSNLKLKINEISNIVIYTTQGDIPYGNINIPSTPVYDSLRPYSFVALIYSQGAKNWKELRYYCSKTPFFYSSNSYIKNESSYTQQIFNNSTQTWGQETILSAGEVVKVNSQSNTDYCRIYANYDILNEFGDIYLLAHYFSPIEHGNNKTIKKIINNVEELNQEKTASNVNNYVYLANGTLYGMASNTYAIIKFILKDNKVTEYFLGFIIGETRNEQHPAGIYFFLNGNKSSNEYISKIELTNSTIKISEIYQSIFKKQDASNVYIFDELVLNNLIDTGNAETLDSELKRFGPGDIILIPTRLLQGG